MTPNDTGRADIPAVSAARQAYAAVKGIAPGEVTVVAADEVTWPDSSLGCPRPWMSYLQVLTPGYRVTLRAGDEQAEYHTSRTGTTLQVIRCDKPAGTNDTVITR